MRFLFKLLSIFRDLNALSRGTYHKRYVRKRAHRSLGRLLRKL